MVVKFRFKIFYINKMSLLSSFGFLFRFSIKIHLEKLKYLFVEASSRHPKNIVAWKYRSKPKLVRKFYSLICIIFVERMPSSHMHISFFFIICGKWWNWISLEFIVFRYGSSFPIHRICASASVLCAHNISSVELGSLSKFQNVQYSRTVCLLHDFQKQTD